MREPSGIRAEMVAESMQESFANSGGIKVGAGVRLRSSLVRVSLSSSTDLEGLVMSSLSTTLASLRRTLRDSLEDLKSRQKTINVKVMHDRAECGFYSCKSLSSYGWNACVWWCWSFVEHEAKLIHLVLMMFHGFVQPEHISTDCLM